MFYDNKNVKLYPTRTQFRVPDNLQQDANNRSVSSGAATDSELWGMNSPREPNANPWIKPGSTLDDKGLQMHN